MIKPVFNYTDIERYQILKKCNDVLFTDTKLIAEFNDNVEQQVANYFDIFDKIRAYKEFIEEENRQQREKYLKLFYKARLFVKHYFQTMYMSIERGELPKTTAEYYGLTYPFEIPNIEKEEDLLEVAKKLFENDARRTSEGGKYFTNPGIGAVRAWVDKFTEVYTVQKNSTNTKQAKIENIETIRDNTDHLLSDIFYAIFNTVENEDIEKIQKTLTGYGFKIEDDSYDMNIDLLPNNETKSNEIYQLKFDL